MNLPQDGIKLHRGNFIAIGQQIQPYLENGNAFAWCLNRGVRNAVFPRMHSATCGTAKSVNTSSAGEIVRYRSMGKRCSQHTYLGYETKDLVDVVTGEITTIQSLRHTSDLDTGEMYVFLCKVEAWAVNIGCHLTIPQSCEFQLLRDKQEA